MISRRSFLRNTGALGVATGFAANLGSFNAFAADVSDYKALVCVFLKGGMDGHDLVIPYDQNSFNDFEIIRETLFNARDNAADVASRRREFLLELGGAGGNLGGRNFAFPEEFRPLHELYEQGDLAVLGNVGPLIEPLTRETYQNGSGVRPARLFSHNDQQSTWMAAAPEGASEGWGGRFGDIAQAANANQTASFTAVSPDGAAVFLNGQTIQPFQMSTSGALSVDKANSNNVLGSRSFSSLLVDNLRHTGAVPQSLFEADIVDVMRASLDNNAALEAEFERVGEPQTIFPEGGLSGQLQVVARTIASRETFGMKRQIFFVGTGGFDTHSNQATSLPQLQANIANSMRAFHDEMVRLGVEDKVTSFTASDFGRTLGLNSSGTDHGWGGHHIVMGGAVNGGQILGGIPPAAFDHDYDTGRGRLIPQVSVDQYAGALGRWFGLSDSELLDALPGIGNFDLDTLGGLFS